MEITKIKREIKSFIDEYEPPKSVKNVLKILKDHKKLIICLIILVIIWGYLANEE